MKRGSAMKVVVAVLMVVLHLSAALPPDFFRHGRPAEKRSEVASAIVEESCSYCELRSADLAASCRQDLGAARKLCMLGYLTKVRAELVKRGFLL